MASTRVLIIDDEPAITSMLQDSLIRPGLRCLLPIMVKTGLNWPVAIPPCNCVRLNDARPKWLGGLQDYPLF